MEVGAFIAGLMVSASDHVHETITSIEALRNFFAALVSGGREPDGADGMWGCFGDPTAVRPESAYKREPQCETGDPCARPRSS